MRAFSIAVANRDKYREVGFPRAIGRSLLARFSVLTRPAS